MSTLKEFKEKALSQENPFLLNDGHGKILCVKVPIGQAEYIYTMREYLDGKGIVTDIYEKMEMTAIVKTGKIYMIKPYNVMDSYNEEYPENVFYINDHYMDEINSQINKKVFDELYNGLETVALTEGEVKNCTDEARRVLAYKKDINKYISDRCNKNIERISVQKFADSLCGVVDLEEFMRKDFESKKDMWIKLKSHMERIKLFVEHPETVLKTYEQHIVDGLHSVDAKTVQIEFLYHGKIATGKIEREKLLQVVCSNDCFSSYNFTTVKGGEKIIKDLGAGKWKGDKEEVLTCKHINKITYGKKVLYEKNGTL